MITEECQFRPCVLCVEPDSSEGEKLATLLEANDFEPVVARSLGQAIEVLVVRDVSLILCELMIPGFSPTEVFRALRLQRSGAITIFHSHSEEICGEAKYLFAGVFERLRKPAESHEIIGSLRRAFAFGTQKQTVMDQIQESTERMRNKLDWLIWKEKRRHKERISTERTLISNIRHSIAQGTGLGGLVTQVEIIQMVSRPIEQDVRIPKAAFDALVRLGADAMSWFETLDSVIKVFSARYPVTRIENDEISLILNQSLRIVEHFRIIKGQTVRIENFAFCEAIESNAALLGLVFREILTNAFKYSPNGSNIDITTSRCENQYSILIVNDIEELAGGVSGIPEEFSHQVLEPFFRINNTYDERFRNEELGMGVGLAALEGGLSQTGSNLLVYEVMDHSVKNGPKRRVIAEIVFQIASQSCSC